MKKKHGLTLEQHKELGEKLHKMRNELVHISSMIKRSYTFKRAPRISNVVSDLDRLRSDMENLLFEDFPNEADIRIYYPIKEGVCQKAQ